MKTLTSFTLVLICAMLWSSSVKAQLVDRKTNNNKTYTDSTAKDEIFSLYNDLQQGQDFHNLAFKYSQDPGSYKQGGELRPSSMDDYVDEYRKVVLELTPNEISRPFKTDYGYHIVQLISNKDNLYTTKHILLRVD